MQQWEVLLHEFEQLHLTLVLRVTDNKQVDCVIWKGTRSREEENIMAAKGCNIYRHTKMQNRSKEEMVLFFQGQHMKIYSLLMLWRLLCILNNTTPMTVSPSWTFWVQRSAALIITSSHLNRSVHILYMYIHALVREMDADWQWSGQMNCQFNFQIVNALGEIVWWIKIQNPWGMSLDKGFKTSGCSWKDFSVTCNHKWFVLLPVGSV